jgi:8-oxo-dGTP diphosphatase
MDEQAPPTTDKGSAALVGALIVRDGMLLLGLRSSNKASCPDMWDVLGGHVGAGETFEHALLRELDEEAGIRPLVYSEHSRHPLPQDGVLVLFRITHWTCGEPRLRNDEHVKLRWFWIEEACSLPNLAAPEYVQIFRSFDISSGARP